MQLFNEEVYTGSPKVNLSCFREFDRNDGKDPLPAVSRSYAIIRRKELIERAVGKSC